MGHYLVTGAAGFIASKVVELLLDDGHTVTGLDNLNDAYDVRLKQWRLQRLRCPGFDFRELDICDREALREQVFEGVSFDAVINLAARAGVRQSVADPHLYIQTNVEGALTLLECAGRSAWGNLCRPRHPPCTVPRRKRLPGKPADGSAFVPLCRFEKGSGGSMPYLSLSARHGYHRLAVFYSVRTCGPTGYGAPSFCSMDCGGTAPDRLRRRQAVAGLYVHRRCGPRYYSGSWEGGIRSVQPRLRPAGRNLDVIHMFEELLGKKAHLVFAAGTKPMCPPPGRTSPKRAPCWDGLRRLIFRRGRVVWPRGTPSTATGPDDPDELVSCEDIAYAGYRIPRSFHVIVTRYG